MKLISILFPVLMTALPGFSQTLTALPQGKTGIASRYLNDASIAADTAVIFADNFESYADSTGLPARWNGGVYHYVSLVTGANVYAGAKSLRFRNPKQTAELSNTVDRLVNPELDVLFLRYYSKFDTSFDVVGSSHNGCSIQASYMVNGNATPGVKANGYNKFLATFECWRGQSADPSPGFLNVYIYHPEQRDIWGDHFFPTGLVMPNTSIPGNFGPDFVARPDTVPRLGQWYCYEFMVKANTPGLRDGRIACWLDGKLMADFPNLRLRDIDTLKIDRFGIGLHIGQNPVCETYKYYDNVVAAKSYIGPVSTNASVRGFYKSPDQVRTNIPVSQSQIYDIKGRVVGKVSIRHGVYFFIVAGKKGERTVRKIAVF
jgi:hypothetical protein